MIASLYMHCSFAPYIRLQYDGQSIGINELDELGYTNRLQSRLLAMMSNGHAFLFVNPCKWVNLTNYKLLTLNESNH